MDQPREVRAWCSHRPKGDGCFLMVAQCSANFSAEPTDIDEFDYAVSVRLKHQSRNL
jgi:hypothetical protein